MSRFPRPRGTSISGFTMMELMIGISIVSVLGIAISPFITNTLPVKKLMTLADAERAADRAANYFMQDLREASPASFTWTTIPQIPPAQTGTIVTSINFSTLEYNLADPTAPPISTAIRYAYVPRPGKTTGELVRTTTKGAVVDSDILLTDVQPPSDSFPLVYNDTTTYHVLAITLTYCPPNVAPVRLVRRAAIKG